MLASTSLSVLMHITVNLLDSTKQIVLYLPE